MSGSKRSTSVSSQGLDGRNDAGIPAMIHPNDAVSWLGVSGFGCRVQVREEDLDAAHEVVDTLDDGEDA